MEQFDADAASPEDHNPMTLKDLPLNGRVLKFCNSESGKIVRWSSFFNLSNTMLDVLHKGIGFDYDKIYSVDVQRIVADAVRERPMSLFFKSENMTPVPIFKMDAIESVFNHSSVKLTLNDRLMIKAYNDFHTQLKNMTGSTCMPRRLFNVNEDVLAAMIKRQVFKVIQDENNPQPLLQDVYDWAIEKKLAGILKRICHNFKEPDYEQPRQPAMFDPSQLRAYNAMFTVPITVLDAGGGYGKTEVLMAAVCEMARRGERVLILAPTNPAVERILSKLNGVMDRTSPDLGFRRQTEELTWNNTQTKLEVVMRHLDEYVSKQYGCVIVRTIQSLVYDNKTQYDETLELTQITRCMVDEVSMLGFPDATNALACLPCVQSVSFIGDFNQNPPVGFPSLMAQLIRVCKRRIDGWQLLQLEVCHRVDPDSLLIVQNCESILKKTELTNVSEDFTTPWTHYQTKKIEDVGFVAQTIMEREGWDKLKLLKNTFFIAYNHDDVDDLNLELFKFHHPNRPPTIKRNGTLFLHERIVFTSKRMSENVQIYNNTFGVIIQITMAKNITKQNEFLEMLENRPHKIEWANVKNTTTKAWWRCRLHLDTGKIIHLIHIPKHEVSPAYAFTDTRSQSLDVHTVAQYYSNRDKNVNGKRPIQNSYLGPSRGKKRVVVWGNIDFFKKERMRVPSQNVFCVFSQYFS